MPFKDKAKQLEAQRRHYARNSETIKAKVLAINRELKRRNKEFIDNIKTSNPCEDCGVFYPSYVMQFDHIVDGKRDSIANMVRQGVSLATLQAEIDKCELVCANCHAERTNSRIREGKDGLSEWI